MARVLIIDDSSTVAAAVTSAVQQDGHEAETLSLFGTLPEVLTRFHPDVIILDLMMPGFNGVQFARFIQRCSDFPPPIVLHSGSDQELIANAAREIKPFEIVPKGTSERDLRRVVARAVAQRRRTESERAREAAFLVTLKGEGSGET